MTGFAKIESTHDQTNYSIEVRSLNSRYLDVYVHLPDELQSYELLIREQVKKHLSRGKVNITLTIDQAIGSSNQLNITLLNNLLNMSNEIQRIQPNLPPLSIDTIMQWPSILMQSTSCQISDDAMSSLLEQALNQLKEYRYREGQGLSSIIVEKLQLIQKYVAEIKAEAPKATTQHHEYLIGQIQQIESTVSAERLQQEVAIIMQKSDIKEELDRLGLHLDEAFRILNKGGLVGRRLDFLMQEFNREANTIGSKSSGHTIVSRIIDIKVLIEQIREQVQNME